MSTEVTPEIRAAAARMIERARMLSTDVSDEEIAEIERLGREFPLSDDDAARLYAKVGQTLGWTQEKVDAFLAERKAKLEAGRREA